MKCRCYSSILLHQSNNARKKPTARLVIGTTKILRGKATQKEVSQLTGQVDKVSTKLPFNSVITSDIPPDMIIDIMVENR